MLPHSTKPILLKVEFLRQILATPISLTFLRKLVQWA